MGDVDYSERRSCTLGDAREANMASSRRTYEDARDEAVRDLLHRVMGAAVGHNDGNCFIRWEGHANRNRGHWRGNRGTRKRTTSLWARERMNSGTETEQQGKGWMYLEGPRRMVAEANRN